MKIRVNRYRFRHHFECLESCNKKLNNIIDAEVGRMVK